MVTLVQVAQVASISIALAGAGGIATLSIFDIPELQAQPASRSLPSVRWLFSRGSHIFPTAAFTAATGFAFLAYRALPITLDLSSTLRAAVGSSRVLGYLAAGLLSFSIAPVTSVMIPTNFRLIKMNEEKGGTRSAKSATVDREEPGMRSAGDSVEGKGEAAEFTDLSGPQGRTDAQSTEAENAEVRRLLHKFAQLNLVRAVFLGAGGVVGLITALA